MVVVVDKGGDPLLVIAGRIMILEQDAVFQRLVPTIDFPLGLGMARRVIGWPVENRQPCLAV
jgi:hypothetical protein